MATNYPLTAGTLTDQLCYPSTPQSLYNEMFSKGYVALDIDGVVFSETEPAVTNRGKLWVKLDGNGKPVRQFKYGAGGWKWPHETPANDARRQIFTGAAAAVDTLDGGTAGAVTESSGPFWEIDTSMAYRMPVGVGTLPDSGTVLAVTDTGGADEHTLITAELPAHNHDLNGYGPASPKLGVNTSNGDILFGVGAGATSSHNTSNTGSGDGHNNMPPYYAVYFIKRTARVYYTA